MPSTAVHGRQRMREAFLRLPSYEQSQIYQTLATRMGRSPLVLEKDVWV